MQLLSFWKYHGAGNDFIMVDQREKRLLAAGGQDQGRIAWLCRRHFGVGADGLILLEEAEGYHFRMIYFNADGREGSFCGNGGRCAVAFAHSLMMVDEACRFLAYDGPHEALIPRAGWIELRMKDIQDIDRRMDACCLDTGSPHFVRFVPLLERFPVEEEGRRIRYSPEFLKEGINVNFAEKHDGGLRVATYERGVEAETLSCGTGVTAAAMAYVASQHQPVGDWDIPVQTKGGNLQVRFHYDGHTFSQVWLCGPAEKLFAGSINYAAIPASL